MRSQSVVSDSVILGTTAKLGAASGGYDYLHVLDAARTQHTNGPQRRIRELGFVSALWNLQQAHKQSLSMIVRVERRTCLVLRSGQSSARS